MLTTTKEKKITNAELLESINRSFSKMETKMATKDDLLKLELKLTTEIHDIRMDFKSFKKDSNDSINKHTVDIDDLNDSLLLQDKRIEKLELKSK